MRSCSYVSPFSLCPSFPLCFTGGRTVYLGPSTEALSYFEQLGFECPRHSNPSDFFMDVISGMVPRQVREQRANVFVRGL